jgi:hypothetical protein
MILALLAFVAFQDAPPEPATRGELDAVLADYRAAKFDVSIDAAGKLNCTPDRKFASAELSIRTCMAAANCIMSGKRDGMALTECVDADRSDIAKDYRRDWLKSHPK